MSERSDLNYVVFASIPYEGETQVFYGDLEALKAWVNNEDRGYYLDDCQCYVTTEAPDLYSLRNRESS